MARLTRHEILKEDRFMLTLEGLRDFYLSKQKQILLTISVVALIALSVAGYLYYSAHQNEKAKDALSQALKTYRGSITEAAQPPTTTSTVDLSFKSDAEKYEKALSEFQKVSTDYASRSAGKIAKYYAGLCLKELHRNKEAVAILEPLGQEKSDYGVLALLALASVYESSGDLAKATEVFKRVVESGSVVAPKGVNLMHLAKLYEQQNKTNEATKIYQQIVKDFPGTPLFNEADQKLKQIAQ